MSQTTGTASAPKTACADTAFITKLGLEGAEPALVHVDMAPANLIEASVERHEGTLTSTGSIAVTTGEYTGRAPQNRFIVDTPNVHDRIAWGKVNAPMATENFDRIYEGVRAYLAERDTYVVRGNQLRASHHHRRRYRLLWRDQEVHLLHDELPAPR